ncbi:MAG: GNAT family N-acetyltransferase [Actinomycetota bacterium]
MIELTEEPYDGDVAQRLVRLLMLELNERYAGHEDADDPDDDEYLAEVTPEMVRRPLGAFLVAWLDGAAAVGCGALKPLGGDPAHGEIKRMYTLPTARRRGVSRVVLEGLESIAAELGYARIQLETGLAQPEAISLYESHGWHRIPNYGHYKHSPMSVCFAKEVAT